jgi:hypothetical protein
VAAALARDAASSDAANPGLRRRLDGTGNVTTAVGMGGRQHTPLNETITITKGVNAPLLVVVGTCSLQMDSHGTMATLRPGRCAR